MTELTRGGGGARGLPRGSSHVRRCPRLRLVCQIGLLVPLHGGEGGNDGGGLGWGDEIGGHLTGKIVVVLSVVRTVGRPASKGCLRHI